jgi:hypothetical protein
VPLCWFCAQCRPGGRRARCCCCAYVRQVQTSDRSRYTGKPSSSRQKDAGGRQRLRCSHPLWQSRCETGTHQPEKPAQPRKLSAANTPKCTNKRINVHAVVSLPHNQQQQGAASNPKGNVARTQCQHMTAHPVRPANCTKRMPTLLCPYARCSRQYGWGIHSLSTTCTWPAGPHWCRRCTAFEPEAARRLPASVQNVPLQVHQFTSLVGPSLADPDPTGDWMVRWVEVSQLQLLHPPASVIEQAATQCAAHTLVLASKQRA